MLGLRLGPHHPVTRISAWWEGATARRADLGISMRTSSSGLDLAMKVVDLFAARVPVCAFDYGGSLPEQIEPNQTGFLFRTAPELAAILTRLDSDPSPLEAMRGEISVRWQITWSENWQEVVSKLLVLS